MLNGGWKLGTFNPWSMHTLEMDIIFVTFLVGDFLAALEKDQLYYYNAKHFICRKIYPKHTKIYTLQIVRDWDGSTEFVPVTFFPVLYIENNG